MNSALWMLLGWLCWSLIVARVAWKSGYAAGARRWDTGSERAYRLGLLAGRREERTEVDR